MGLTRRDFLTTTAICAAPATSFVFAEGPPPEATGLPDGVIKPFEWGVRQIPSSGSGTRATTVLDKSIANVMRKHGIVGCAVCVVRGTTIGYAKGFGYAQLPGAPFLSSTASRCGSLAKPITGLCALVLADQGKLDLDAEVVPILKEAGVVPRPVGTARVDERISRITIRNLMDHTSGLPSGTAYTAWRPGRDVAALHGLDRVPTAADVVSDGLGNARLDFDPGTKYQYANANFVILARVIEAKSRTPFGEFLTRVAMPKFGLKPDEVYVSLNQSGLNRPPRGKNEAAYYQTSDERFPSFVPAERPRGRVYGEAYGGYATEASDGAGGIACTALGVGKILARLHSAKPGLSRKGISEILTPPSHYARQAKFDPANSTFYSKGFDVRFSGGRP